MKFQSNTYYKSSNPYEQNLIFDILIITQLIYSSRFGSKRTNYMITFGVLANNKTKQ